MENFTETEIKYLAGLIDSDGHISFNFVSNRIYLTIGITQSVDYDRFGYLESLCKKAGNVYYRSTSGADQKSWCVKSRRDLNILVPRLVKHMVVKGAHLSRMYQTYLDSSGTVLTDLQIEQFKLWSKHSRQSAGPLKPKNHPTWAWVAGYLDGDGHYNFSEKRSYARIEVCSHKNDLCGLELLQKAFGGSILPMNGSDNFRWFKNLGKRDRAFARSFLKRVHRHSQFKKWKIEQILAFHNQAATTECEEP